MPGARCLCPCSVPVNADALAAENLLKAQGRLDECLGRSSGLLET